MTDVSDYKTKLETEHGELIKELKSIGIHNPEIPEDWIAVPEKSGSLEADPNMSSDRNEDWMERRALMAPLESRYNNVVRALNKIKNGAYGICEVCSKKIEVSRLGANAAARTCKEHLEKERSLPK